MMMMNQFKTISFSGTTQDTYGHPQCELRTIKAVFLIVFFKDRQL